MWLLGTFYNTIYTGGTKLSEEGPVTKMSHSSSKYSWELHLMTELFFLFFTYKTIKIMMMWLLLVSVKLDLQMLFYIWRSRLQDSTALLHTHLYFLSKIFSASVISKGGLHLVVLWLKSYLDQSCSPHIRWQVVGCFWDTTHYSVLQVLWGPDAGAVMNEPRLGLPRREESSPSPAHP